MNPEPEAEQPASTSHRSGYVAIVGRPNVGKSTLLNALMQQKLSIVTRKPQTTRQRVLGILSGDDHQIILLDTPGIIKPAYRMQEAMMADVKTSVSDADIMVFMVDATFSNVDDVTLKYAGETPSILILNKIDKMSQEEVLPLAAAYNEAHPFHAVIPISALKGFNVDRVLNEIQALLPPGPPFYPKDQISEQPERFFISEIIREKIFLNYQKDVPYSTQVDIVACEERSSEKDLIDAEIIVERDSQKGILIGKSGEALKKIGTQARADIEEFLGRGVFLRLFVKVRNDWRNNEGHLRSFGFTGV